MRYINTFCIKELYKLPYYDKLQLSQSKKEREGISKHKNVEILIITQSLFVMCCPF